ncbi:MAG TPA: DUF1552 domain-containing protein [Polyangia bacterium]|nr:DUF1552 domain-containing protein [Polyangia bacterium]
MNNSRERGALSRRRFLGGGAVVVGLPFLESMIPKAARAESSQGAAKRLLYWWIPNGVWMDSFRPTTTGTGYAMPPVLAALEPLRSDFSVVTGLQNDPAKPDQIGDHASGTSGFITCVHALKSTTNIRLGISADQVAANGLLKNGIKTRVQSLQLGIDGGSSAGGCDSGYSCAYSRNVTWADALTPLPKVTDPLQAFQKLFMGYDPTASAADVARRRAYDKSVLDYVTGDISSLTVKLGKTDAAKLDQYLTGVRALEGEVMNAASGNASCGTGTPPPAAATDYPTHVKLMLDLIVLAFQCDATRVVSFMQGNSTSNQTYPFLTANGAPINAGHHNISHHGGNPNNIAQLIAINTWTFQQVAYFLSKLKAIPDGPLGSNLLTNSAIFISSDISDGDRHNHNDMPIVLAGHGGGALKPGQHVRYGNPIPVGAYKNIPVSSGAGTPVSSGIPVSNLLLTTLATVGVTGVTVGDSTGVLTEV